MGEPVAAIPGGAAPVGGTPGMPSPVTGRVLVVLSSARAIELVNGTMQRTGHFLIELVEPLQALLAAGYAVEFANPNGQECALDPLSDSRAWFVKNLHPNRDYDRAVKLLQYLRSATNYSNPRRLDELTDQELNAYTAIFLPGGHAPMVDLMDQRALGSILRYFHEAGKPTALICHAPIALLSTLKRTQQTAAAAPAGAAEIGASGAAEGAEPLQGMELWAYRGYRMCCYSNTEEMANEALWGTRLRFRVEDELRRHGAVMDLGLPMISHCVVDKELLTGQGPTSGEKLGQMLVDLLSAYQAHGSLRAYARPPHLA